MTAKLGILAGSGDLPARLVAACRASGREHFVIALNGETEAEAVAEAPQAWLDLPKVGRIFKTLHDQHCREVVLAGPIRRPALRQLKPDRRGLAILPKLLAAGGDDGLLRIVIEEIESEGFRVVGVDDILADLVAGQGPLGRCEPAPEQQPDLVRGIAVAQALGALDVGQAVVVQQGHVLGVEAAEGTDALLQRCAALRREGPGGVLVKLCKPGQEARADLPTIGPETVAAAAASGLAGIAIEAGAALVLDHDAVVEAADRKGVFVLGLGPEDLGDA
ncbi:MAG: UDP-2,3-diacylglucosamine diphosphatase LpxI [Alphaproteobacteria bacterium]|nr:UDP-2,3-diacylglucosamine diphosphatase LpxI [Alphaproteobacteria bacterium]MDP6621596.1 UDP-2,3-diacylglucosamine diphosphatase LpxI [Alphaproteobacteria bacterium]